MKTLVADTLMNILVVSENPKDASQLKNMVRLDGPKCSFNHCPSVGNALKFLSESNKVDVVLLDLHLPDSTGLATLHTIKDPNTDIPVIVLARDEDKELISSIRNEGAEDYISKNNLTVDNVSFALKCANEWKKIKEIKEKISHQSTILAKATEEIIKCENAQSIFKTICCNLGKLNPNLKTIAFSVEGTDSKQAKVTCTSGLENHFSIITQLTGFNLFRVNFPIDKYSSEMMDLFADARIHPIRGGIYEISAGRYNIHIAKFVEKILDIQRIYGIGFCKNEVMYGGLIILTDNPLYPEEKSIIEALSSQASLHMQQKVTEEELKNSEKRYRSFFVDSPVPKWERDYSEIKKEIEKLKLAGIKNLFRYFEKNPGMLDEWITKVKITDINPAVIEYFHAPSREELLKSPPAITKEIRDSYLKEFLYIFHDKTKFDVERELHTLDGKIRRLYLRWAVADGFENTLERVIVSGFDTTEIKKSERALLRLKEGLEQKLQENSKDMISLNSQLEKELQIRNEVEKKLRDSENLFKLLTNQSPDMIMFFDKDLRVLYVNPAVERTTGIPADIFLNKNFEDKELPDHVSKVKLMFKRALEKRGIVEDELRIINEEGEKVYNIRIVPVIAGDGSVESFISFSRDISEERKAAEALKENEEKFHRLTESSNALICEIDSQGYFTYVNKNYFENLGYRQQDLIGQQACIICHPDMKDEFINKLIGQNKNILKAQRNEWLFKDKDGNWRWFSCFSNATVTTKGQRHVSLVSFDITEKKTVEEQLIKFVADLKYLNATKDKFFRIIAHDLKNPFSILLGASEILVNNFENYDQSSLREFGKMINSAAKSGFSLLENLLEWARSQTGNLNFVPQLVNVKEVVDELVLNTYVYALNKSIRLQSTVPEDLVVFADKNMLNTIFRNLLNNAIKFTYEGGEITIDVEKSENFALLSVKDTGVGIEKADIDKLFRIDVKHTSRGTAQETGTGLGLILCREFVEKQGGKIWVKSTPGKGSVFSFTIPLEQKKE